MSGCGRKSQYRKGATAEYLKSDYELSDGEMIAKVLANKGGSRFEIEVSDGCVATGILPNKFRNLIFIKRNDYLVIRSIEVTDESPGDKLNFDIVEILNKDQVKYLKRHNQWPDTFSDNNRPNDDIMMDHIPAEDADADMIEDEDILAEDQYDDGEDEGGGGGRDDNGDELADTGGGGQDAAADPHDNSTTSTGGGTIKKA
jgi:probable RNA-binding protein EIF1AD